MNWLFSRKAYFDFRSGKILKMLPIFCKYFYAEKRLLYSSGQFTLYQLFCIEKNRNVLRKQNKKHTNIHLMS
jgi:hypothetical protein